MKGPAGLCAPVFLFFFLFCSSEVFPYPFSLRRFFACPANHSRCAMMELTSRSSLRAAFSRHATSRLLASSMVGDQRIELKRAEAVALAVTLRDRRAEIEAELITPPQRVSEAASQYCERPRRAVFAL